MWKSKPAISIIPQQEKVRIGTLDEQQSYNYSDSKLSEILQDSTTVKVFADAVSDRQLLQQYGKNVNGQIFDIKLADSLLTAGLGKDNSYSAIAERYLEKTSPQPNPQDLLALRENLREKLASEQLVDVALVEFDATKATAQMSQNGIRLDTAWLKDKQQQFRQEQPGLESQVKDWLGERLPSERDQIRDADLISTKQVEKTQTLEWFNQAGIPLKNFDKNHIQSLVKEHPILNQFQRMRSLDGLIGNKGLA